MASQNEMEKSKMASQNENQNPEWPPKMNPIHPCPLPHCFLMLSCQPLFLLFCFFLHPSLGVLLFSHFPLFFTVFIVRFLFSWVLSCCLFFMVPGCSYVLLCVSNVPVFTVVVLCFKFGLVSYVFPNCAACFLILAPVPLEGVYFFLGHPICPMFSCLSRTTMFSCFSEHP